jgi:transketolase
MSDLVSPPPLDVAASKERCVNYRRRILGVSQKTPLHVAPAFSCLEMVDVIYFGLLRRKPDGELWDTFILSKGHGAAAQYVVLEKVGLLPSEDIDLMCQAGGRLGSHPDFGLPGIEAATGSLGHGLPIAVGMALADRLQQVDRLIYLVLSDGELQEGSVWEALMLAPTLRLDNIIVYVDLNDQQSLGQTSKVHPNFYPIREKIEMFGWEVAEVDGHDPFALWRAALNRKTEKPFLVLGKTVKGKGVSYMENVTIWHYRSPNAEEYQQALRELETVPA